MSAFSDITKKVYIFLAIALALITKEVYSSLFIGIVLGGLLTANYTVKNGLIEDIKFLFSTFKYSYFTFVVSKSIEKLLPTWINEQKQK